MSRDEMLEILECVDAVKSQADYAYACMLDISDDKGPFKVSHVVTVLVELREILDDTVTKIRSTYPDTNNPLS